MFNTYSWYKEYLNLVGIQKAFEDVIAPPRKITPAVFKCGTEGKYKDNHLVTNAFFLINYSSCVLYLIVP